MSFKAPTGGPKNKGSISSKVTSLAKKMVGGGGTSSHPPERRQPMEEDRRKTRESPAEEDRRRRKEALREKKRVAAAAKGVAAIEEEGPSPCKASSRGRGSSREEEVLGEREDSQGPEAMEEDENDNSNATTNFYAQHTRSELTRMFDHFVDQPMRAPNEVLEESSHITEEEVEGMRKKYGFPSPYYIRAPRRKERVCFPGENEIGVYVGSLESGLRFPLIEEVEAIYSFYGYSLAQFMPTSNGCIFAFLSLLRRKRIPFSLPLFRHFFQLTSHNKAGSLKAWVNIGSRSKKKLVQ